MTDLNIDRIERRLELRGLLPSRPTDPPAVAFVDVSGFTRLTVDRGDEYGARIAVRLGELADVVVRRRGGRVMKLLGDGVLLLFESPCDGVGAVAELSREMVKAGLPTAHAGLHAGPVVERDGDIFGSTVNMAARIAMHAPAGSILVSEAVVMQCPSLAGRFESLGSVAVRGLADPVTLYRWKPRPPTPAS
jgi:class 3 adenylate cyclase